MDDALQRLLDEMAITRQILNYCRSMDRCDEALGHAVFLPEATADYGPIFSGLARDFVTRTCAAHFAMENHQHKVSNILIRVDGDSAGSETYVDARFRGATDGQAIERSTRGRYLDRWARRDGGWFIAHRAYVHETDEVRPVGPTRFPPAGARDPGDLSYTLIG